MPTFTIPLEGGGEIHQNGATYADAVANAAAAGAHPASSGGGTSSSQSGGGGGGAPVYNTVNGPKTAAQMEQELHAAGWPGPVPGTEGPGAIANAYAQTTGGPVTPTSNQPGGAPAGGPGGPAPAPDQGANLQAAQLLLNQAQQAAYQAYLSARLNLETDQLAFQKAQAAFQNTINEAQLTGTYQGHPTLAAQQQQAELTGVYNGTPTLAAQAQQAQITGYDANGRPTFAREQQQQRTAQDYLNLIASLRGPQDYGQYLRVLGSTPGGIRDLVSSAAGNYVPATGATTNAGTQAASLGGLVNTAATGASGGTTYASYQQAAQGLPRPNQISPDAWNSYTDSQKKILLGLYESQGFNPQDVQDLYNQSLPRYGATTGAGTIRLR